MHGAHLAAAAHLCVKLLLAARNDPPGLTQAAPLDRLEVVPDLVTMEVPRGGVRFGASAKALGLVGVRWGALRSGELAESKGEPQELGVSTNRGFRRGWMYVPSGELHWLAYMCFSIK